MVSAASQVVAPARRVHRQIFGDLLYLSRRFEGNVPGRTPIVPIRILLSAKHALIIAALLFVPASIAQAHDFNGDGQADILWRNTTSGVVYEWLLNGTTIIGQGSPGSPGADWMIAGVGDFNGDGK